MVGPTPNRAETGLPTNAPRSPPMLPTENVKPITPRERSSSRTA